ncbi:MAG: FeoB-associated Cys-rich membrane protein [Clostridia bacterium]|nr:FeoB-associated Cys-rich membrane protein [Clostridia bacterium]
MKNIIATLVIIAILALAIFYIVKQKKNGAKCIGCPVSGCCQNKAGNSPCTCGKPKEQ